MFKHKAVAREIVQQFNQIEMSEILGEIIVRHGCSLEQASRIWPQVVKEFQRVKRRAFLAAAEEPLNV
jgi:hypothetical protein